MEHWLKHTNGFSYYFSRELEPGEVFYLQMPPTTPNRRGINDIGFACSGDIKLYGTLSLKYNDPAAIWQEINPFDEINKTVTWLKMVNGGTDSAAVNIKAIMF